MRNSLAIAVAAMLGLFAGVALAAPEAAAPDGDAETIGRTPPRLSYIDGQVSFWRPGAEDWVQAQINTALAPGDQLFVSGAGGLELQIGAQAFVRAGDDTQIELETREPDFLRFRVTNGQAAFDIRALASGRTVEVGTPHAAFTIDHQGYYRLDVSAARTAFTTRRTGRATVIPAGGDAVPLESDETVEILGPSNQTMAFQAAPQLDAWDNWNYARTDQLMEARSLRYLSPDTYGASDLDRYGAWRTLPTYGSVWIPSGVGPDWAPYSTGSWIYDPYFGWTWVDTAPWGWAPYHYGRWVHVNGYWCWAPGRVIRRAVYAPALVAFLGRPGVSVGISIGGPPVGWVSLGWGEPLVPWWGRPGFIHRPWWGGWGGPHIVNNRVIHHRTIVKIDQIQFYHNTRVRHAVVAVGRDHFGRGPIHRQHSDRVQNDGWRPLHQAPRVRPTAASYVPTANRGPRPRLAEKKLEPAVMADELRHRVAPVSAREPGRDIRPTAKPAGSRISTLTPEPSGVGRPQKANAHTLNPSASPRRPQVSGAAGPAHRQRPQRRANEPTALISPTERPSNDRGRETGSGAAAMQPPKFRTGPASEAFKGGRSTAGAAPVRARPVAPAKESQIQPTQPAWPRVHERNPDRPGMANNPGPAVRAPGRQHGRNEINSPSRGMPPQVPDGQLETLPQRSRNVQGNSTGGRSHGSGNYRRAPQSDGRTAANQGYPRNSGSQNGYQRRFNK